MTVGVLLDKMEMYCCPCHYLFQIWIFGYTAKEDSVIKARRTCTVCFFVWGPIGIGGCCLKALDAFSNCQDRSSHLVCPNLCKQKITNLWKFCPNWSLKLQENNEKKNNRCIDLCAFRCLIEASGLKSFTIRVGNYHSLRTSVTSEGAVSHNILYYQQLSIAR